MDCKEIGCEGVDRIDFAQNRERWRAVMNAAVNLQGCIKCRAVSFSTRTRLHTRIATLTCSVSVLVSLI